MDDADADFDCVQLVGNVDQVVIHFLVSSRGFGLSSKAGVDASIGRQGDQVAFRIAVVNVCLGCILAGDALGIECSFLMGFLLTAGLISLAVASV